MGVSGVQQTGNVVADRRKFGPLSLALFYFVVALYGTSLARGEGVLWGWSSVFLTAWVVVVSFGTWRNWKVELLDDETFQTTNWRNVRRRYSMADVVSIKRGQFPSFVVKLSDRRKIPLEVGMGNHEEILAAFERAVEAASAGNKTIGPSRNEIDGD